MKIEENGVVYCLPPLILIPKGENETTRNKYYVWKNENGNYEVSIANSFADNNFEGNEREIEVGEFGFDVYYEMAKDVKDRPVFAVVIDENREIMAYEVINGYDALLEDYIETKSNVKGR